MSEKLKASRYNHFVKLDNGNRLAFNAMTCGLGEMDEAKYREYKRMINGNGGGNRPLDPELLEDLKRGGFLIPDDLDELDVLRAGHYRARFGTNGFGLTIIPTLRCNFACDYCYENKNIHSLPAEDGGVMSDEVCENIAGLCEKRIQEDSTFTVTWYGGEPMLAKDVIARLTRKITEVCKSKNAKYHAGMITNGHLLNMKNIVFLIKNKVSFIQVTIDGPREIHDKRRPLKSGRGTFDRIMKNISYITDEVPIRVSIRINIDNRNKDDYRILLKEFKARNFHKQKNISVYFGHVIEYNNSCPDISSHCLITEHYSNFLVDANRYAVDQGFKVSIFQQTMIGSCGAVASGTAVIEPTGRIQNCWNAVGNEEMKTGRLTPDGIEMTQNCIKWLGWTPFRKECESCGVLPICMGACPYISIYKKDMLNKEAVGCSTWKYNISTMLPLIKTAKAQKLLIEPNQKKRSDYEMAG